MAADALWEDRDVRFDISSQYVAVILVVQIMVTVMNEVAVCFRHQT